MRKILQSVSSFSVAAGIILACSSYLAAQGGSIRGTLILPAGNTLNESTRISLETSRGVKAVIFTDNQGRFQFLGLTPGSYRVVIEGDKLRFETTTASTEVFPNSPAILNIVLRERKNSNESNGKGTAISTVEFDPDIPTGAKKEFERAANASKEGKPDEAIVHLRKAIELYPRYLMAHNDLGAQLLGQGKLEEAAISLRKAVEIGPKAFNPMLNLGIVLVHQQNYSEAAQTLRGALSLEGNSPAARFYLGRALFSLEELEGAAAEFRTAHDLGGANFSLALYYLGHISMKRGERKRALEMFRRYLAETPHPMHAAEVKKLIESLR